MTDLTSTSPRSRLPIVREARTGFELSDVIGCAAELVDGPIEVSEEYRRGVVELAARLCLCGDDFDDAVTVMGYAVCGVHRPQEAANA